MVLDVKHKTELPLTLACCAAACSPPHRTVQFFGDETSPEWMYGAHILVNTPMRKKTGRSNITLTHVEVKYGGQAFRLGR